MNKNKPAIRFKGFSDAWEQRQLGDIAVKVTEKNTQNTVSETFTNSAEYGVISQRDFFDHDVSNAEKIDGYYIIRNDDFVYNPRISTSAPCGPINRNKMGRNGVMSPLYTVFRTQNISHLFLEWYFKTSHWHPYMYFNGDSGARADRFSIKNDLFFQMPIPLPAEEEQCKIGAILERINNLITLHQRKYEKLQNVKKSMLEKMFPKNGSKFPEIRFKGFTDAWEQRELSNIVDRLTRKNENLESELPLTISAQYGLIDQNEFFEKRIASKDVSGYYLLKKGEFAYNKSTSSDAPWGAVKRLDKYEMGVLSTLYIVFALKMDGNIDSDFLVTYYDTDRWHKEVQAIAAEGARNHGLLNISPNDYFKTNLTISKSVAEQQQIGTFFRKLDHLITLHQRESEKLQNIKKSMLEKMFV